MAWDDSGNLVALWLDGGGGPAAAASSSALAAEGGILGGTFTPQGEPLGPPVEIDDGSGDASTPGVSTDRTGAAVVVWHAPGGPRARVLDQNHQPAGDVFPLDAAGTANDSKPAADRSAPG